MIWDPNLCHLIVASIFLSSKLKTGHTNNYYYCASIKITLSLWTKPFIFYHLFILLSSRKPWLWYCSYSDFIALIVGGSASLGQSVQNDTDNPVERLGLKTNVRLQILSVFNFIQPREKWQCKAVRKPDWVHFACSRFPARSFRAVYDTDISYFIKAIPPGRLLYHVSLQIPTPLCGAYNTKFPTFNMFHYNILKAG